MTGRYKESLAIFRTVMAVINSSPEMGYVLNETLHTILEALGPDFSGALLLHDPPHPGLIVGAQVRVWEQDAPRRVFVEGCPCNRAIDTRMPVFEPDCSGLTCRSSRGGEGPSSRLVTPLRDRHNHVLGVLCLVCPCGFRLEMTDLSLWEDIGTQIGRAIEDAQLHVQLQQLREHLQALYQVSDHLATSLDLDWVLSRVLDLAISATDATRGSIILVPSPDAPSHHILRRELPVANADQVISQVLTKGLAGWVVNHKEGSIVIDTEQDPRWIPLNDDPNPPRSALAVPLLANGQVLGVLTLDHVAVGHFQPQHMGLSRAIAHQSSVAIEKARLHREATHLAEVLAERVEERTRELRETQAQLIQAEKLAALGELAAGIAHEINNPLHILQAYVEYIASRITDDAPIADFLEPMRNALESIARLAGQLRDFSRPAGGEWRPLDANSALKTVLQLVNKELMHNQIELATQLASELPMITGDNRQLEQVFLNMILNARDAMPGGGKLTIETYASEGTVHVRFCDTGTGIPQEDLAQIFEPYFTTKEDRGTGLGLAICQRIVSQHGGKISVSSRLGEGAVFILDFPAGQAAQIRAWQRDADSAHESHVTPSPDSAWD
jgi:two-component system NtrC family sensor kinase